MNSNHSALSNDKTKFDSLPSDNMIEEFEVGAYGMR